jgi:putative endonuclease
VNEANPGKRSEALACDYLQRRGLQLVARNWQSRFGEIDLVFREGGTIVFVEVRLRTSATHGGAGESIDGRKRARLLAAARLYLAGEREQPCRFDVVLLRSLEPPEMEWIRNAISE